MKALCGTDIIEIERIKKAILDFETNKESKFIDKVFTNKEKEYCESKNKVKYQHYSARFAAKEALFKAISPLLKNKFDINWLNAEIINDEQGRPYINLLNLNNKVLEKIENIDVSLSHCKEYAIANVIIQIK